MGICTLGCFASELLKSHLLCGTGGGYASVPSVGLDNNEPGEQGRGVPAAIQEQGVQWGGCSATMCLQLLTTRAGIGPDFER